MRRWLLELSLLAYPSAKRNPDGAYLRDLALELAETYGLPHQLLSILRGGIAERIERRWSSRRPGLRSIGATAVCSVLVATAVVASALSGLASGDAERVEEELLVCVTTAGPAGDCAAERALVAGRQRAGWDCDARRAGPGERREITWRCALGAGDAGRSAS